MSHSPWVKFQLKIRGEQYTMIFEAAQKFAKGFTADKPPLTDFQVEQIWLNGANFVAPHVKIALETVRKEIADKLLKLSHENPCQGDCAICKYAKELQSREQM